MNKEEFKKLQLHWYQILKDEGFDDAEAFDKNGELKLKKTASHGIVILTPFERQIREEHFRLMGLKAQDPDTVFENELERFVLIKYADGSNVKEIRDELRKRGTPRNGHSICYMIRRYMMAWHLKVFTRTELHRKKKKCQKPTPSSPLIIYRTTFKD